MAAVMPARRERRRLRRLLRRLLRVSATAAALFPASVHADDFSLRALDQGDVSFGAGAFVGYQWGERPGVEWGLEAFATRRFMGTGCSTEARAGLGPLLQIGIKGLRDPRLTLALQGGGELVRSVAALTGELGLSYRFGEAPGFGLHLGVTPELVILNASLRYQALQDELWVGGGARMFPTYGEPSMCSVGRPLRTREGALARLEPARGVEQLASESGASRAELAALGFARDAQLECASVPAFLQLGAELLRCGAPLELAERATAAACDELRHAGLCAQLASAGLGERVDASLPAFEARPALTGPAGLERLALESWLDGCLGEGVAARHALRAAQLATDSATRDALQQIARDEQRHAELAWDILAFSLRSGGEPLRAAIRAAAAQPASTAGFDALPHGLERHGRLGHHAALAEAQQHREASLARLHTLEPAIC